MLRQTLTSGNPPFIHVKAVFYSVRRIQIGVVNGLCLVLVSSNVLHQVILFTAAISLLS